MESKRYTVIAAEPDNFCNLIIAFTTTVFGILVGAFAYAASLIRRTWYEQDLSDLEYVVNVLFSADQESEASESSYACQEYKRA